MKKIYFAGSIRGGRQDANLYQTMIKHIKQKHIVLTEHVGDLTVSPYEDGNNHDCAIYLQDTQWLKECDLVIAECSCPSLGVGYELAYAERYHKPVYILYNHTKTVLSAMLTGNSYFRIESYSNDDELFIVLDHILNAIEGDSCE